MMQMSPCRYAMMQIPPCGYAMMWIFWHKHNLFKNSFCFQNQGFLSAWKKNIFKSWFVISQKVIFFFDLRLLKKLVITVRNLRIGHWLEIWWSISRDLFSQIGWAKRWHISKPFSGKINSLKIKHLKKIHFFLVSEYGNLSGVKTHRDGLKNLGKKNSWIEGLDFLILERVKDFVVVSDAS